MVGTRGKDIILIVLIVGVGCSSGPKRPTATPTQTPSTIDRLTQAAREEQAHYAREGAEDCGTVAVGQDPTMTDTCLVTVYKSKGQRAYGWYWSRDTGHILGAGATIPRSRAGGILITLYDSEACPSIGPCHGGFTTEDCLQIMIRTIGGHQALACGNPKFRE